MDYARLIGAIYVALGTGLSDEGQQLVDDVLVRIADRAPPEEGAFLRTLAGKKVTDRPPLVLIQGGAA